MSVLESCGCGHPGGMPPCSYCTACVLCGESNCNGHDDAEWSECAFDLRTQRDSRHDDVWSLRTELEGSRESFDKDSRTIALRNELDFTKREHDRIATQLRSELQAERKAHAELKKRTAIPVGERGTRFQMIEMDDMPLFPEEGDRE